MGFHGESFPCRLSSLERSILFFTASIFLAKLRSHVAANTGREVCEFSIQNHETSSGTDTHHAAVLQNWARGTQKSDDSWHEE